MLMVNHLIGFGAGRELVETLVNAAALTKTGTLTAGGGLAALCDGNTNQSTGAGAFHPSGNADGTFVIDCTAAPKVFAKLVTTGTNDGGGYYDSAISTTINAEGSQDASSWTVVGTSGASVSAASQQRTIESNGDTTAWNYLRGRIVSPGGGQTRAAEMTFYELL
jgi:hypothetical protein